MSVSHRRWSTDGQYWKRHPRPERSCGGQSREASKGEACGHASQRGEVLSDTHDVVASRKWREGVARFGALVAAVVAVAILFQVQTGVVFSVGNLLSIVEFMATMAIVGFGETVEIVAGEIDLSLGALYGLSAMACAQLWVLHGMPFVVAVLVGLLVGAVGGLINGLIVVGLGVNSFITTLGMLNIAEGLTYYISHNTAVSPAGTENEFHIFLAIGSGTLFGVPSQVYWLLGVGAVMWTILHKTVFGFRVSAIGGNVRAARAAKMPVDRTKVLAFVLAGVLAALAGIIDFSLVDSTSATAGSTMIFPVFAAVVIGGASLSGGRGSIIGTLLGALLLETLTNGLGLIGAGAFAQLLFVGAAIIVAVAVDRWTARSRSQRAQL